MKLSVLLVFVASMFAQTKPERIQHGPTAEICLRTEASITPEFLRATRFNDLSKTADTLASCHMTRENHWSERQEAIFVAKETVLLVELHTRETNFLVRHNLMEQFMQEDARR
jgi:hypothetical protein